MALDKKCTLNSHRRFLTDEVGATCLFVAFCVIGSRQDHLNDPDVFLVYFCFKAKVGKCSIPKPGFFDFEGQRKWYVEWFCL